MMLGDQHVLSTLFKLMFWGGGSKDESINENPKEILLGSNAAKFQIDEIGFANIPLSPLDFVKSAAKLHPRE